jgi:hypothetical protein
MNINADDAEAAPANNAEDDDEEEDDASVASVINAADEMDLVLGYIGFDNITVCDRIRNEGLQDFSDLKSLKEKDIRDLSESFTKRTVSDGQFLFGIWRTRLLVGTVHWVQDFGRVGEIPHLGNHFGHPSSFHAARTVASDGADVWKIKQDQSDTVSKAADPGKFKDERKWPEWEPFFVNYLSTIHCVSGVHGVSGVPLSYVVRLKETPDPRINYKSFNEQAIACALLS